MKISALLPLLLCGVLGTTAPASAQQAQEGGQPQEAAALPGPPGAVQITARARVLTDSASLAEGMIGRLRSVEGLASEVEDAERRYRELQGLMGSMTEADFVRLERLSRLRDQALLEDGRLEGVRARLIGRLAELGDLSAQWAERRRLWRSWLEALQSEAAPAEAEAEVTAVLERIENVLEGAAAAASRPLDLQGRVDALRGEIAELSATVRTAQAERRRALLERAEPLLFSGEHRAQLREGGWRAWDPTADIRPEAYLAFARGNLGLLGFYVLLALLIGGVVRTLSSTTFIKGAGDWSGLREHPWALGVFVSVVVAMTRITLAPPLWDVLLWSLFGATAAILGRRFIGARPVRLTIYLLAAFYPAFLLLEVVRLPEPVFRVGLAAVAACAIPLFLLLARDEGAGSSTRSGFLRAIAGRTWPLRLGAGIWIGVLFALVLGFDPLARWALHATVMSAAVVFTVMLALVLVGGTDVALARLGTEDTLARRAGVLLARRLSLLVRVVLVLAGALVLLDIWGVSGSPIATWQRVMDAGFTMGTLRVTVGRTLFGGFVVYLAVLLSGLVRSLVAMGPDAKGRGPLLHADRGVADSITRLGQYAFVTLGVVLALAVLGVQLQNFAIIAGALGIGVGFGLQNVVNNFASGLILLFERPVRVGDTVVVGDVWGTIQKIGLRSTVLLTLDESEMIVPNGHLVSEKVINWTLTSSIARVFLPVSVAYGSPVAQVQEVLRAAAFAHPSVLKEPPPQALFMAFGDSSLNFELRVWVKDIRLRMEMRSTVLADIDTRLREAGIEIPFPQRDLHLRSIDGKVLGELVDRG
jgi:potassium-dependent mechanosensitive channel